eukprot:TRINITY_DN13813_c0_g1_i1.p1 TRINITY_DN13813_c0_g1~~TRINITY_DN13813_c0_g1_i1.p1  ORF type:complete len:131 (+),score=18.04 TRINITY_DN13813_c0_g1_i1:523-915(+)
MSVLQATDMTPQCSSGPLSRAGHMLAPLAARSAAHAAAAHAELAPGSVVYGVSAHSGTSGGAAAELAGFLRWSTATRPACDAHAVRTCIRSWGHRCRCAKEVQVTSRARQRTPRNARLCGPRHSLLQLLV